MAIQTYQPEARVRRSIFLICGFWFFLVLSFIPSVGKAGQSPPCVDAHPLSSVASAQPVPEVLRVLFHRDSSVTCPLSHQEYRLLVEFAELQGRSLRWFSLANAANLLPALKAGQADIVLGMVPEFDGKGMIRSPCPEKDEVPATAGTEQQVCHTLPWTKVRERLVERAGSGEPVQTIAGLGGRQVAVRRQSPAWPLLQSVAAQSPGMSVITIPDEVGDGELMNRVATGRYDVAVTDSLLLAHRLPANPLLRATLNITPPEARTWTLSLANRSLYLALSGFARNYQIAAQSDVIALDDFDRILTRRVLRLITVIAPEHYYLDEGRQQGFEYELLRGFAAHHDLQLEVIPASSPQEMHELLLQGNGDVLAASLPASYVASLPETRATRDYMHVMPVIVGRRSDTRRLLDTSDLLGRRLTLPASSPWFRRIQESVQQESGVELRWATAEGGAQAVLSMVDKGMYDLTVVGSHQLANFTSAPSDLEAKFSLDEPVSLVWATRKQNRRLLAALNEYLSSMYRSADYNMLHRKYFPLIASRTHFKSGLPLSRWDDIVARYASQHGFDWQLIMAMMFQESRFDPVAHSDAGAFGLMQLIPATQDFLQMQNPADPEQSIQAGIQYLDYLRSHFEDELMPEERTWFSLAAYNAGPGRIKEARRLANKMGLDHKVWFGNVEQAMLSLAGKVSINGTFLPPVCRCGQTVLYVREIKTRYLNYLRYVRGQAVAAYFGRRRLP